MRLAIRPPADGEAYKAMLTLANNACRLAIESRLAAVFGEPTAREVIHGAAILGYLAESIPSFKAL